MHDRPQSVVENEAAIDLRSKLESEARAEYKNTTPPLSIEAMRLLVYDENKRRLEAGQDGFNCLVIEANDLIKTIKKIQTIPLTDKPIRIQLLVKHDQHYYGIDILLSKASKECLGFDAGGDIRGLMGINKLIDITDPDGDIFFTKIYMPSEEDPQLNPQKDYESCHIFAFDQLCQSSRIDIFSYLQNRISNFQHENDTNLYALHWDEMPPQLVWNTQSISWLEFYMTKHKSEIMNVLPGLNTTFVGYLAKVKDHDSSLNKEINVSVKILFLDYQNRMRALLKNMPDNELIAITSNTDVLNLQLQPSVSEHKDSTEILDDNAVLDKLKYLVQNKLFWQKRFNTTSDTPPSFMRELQALLADTKSKEAMLGEIVKLAKRKVRSSMFTPEVMTFYKELAALTDESNNSIARNQTIRRISLDYDALRQIEIELKNQNIVK
ncbi:hypothetical protein [Aquicella lusitana]|uniref:Uncharacterized protein n=1 Tax=Aquicella lusitana TaxID=254246 RepID=A0A370G0A3_9COXI|nr:hypothetical protein [Aquicella lusitana]RDI37155.1 hypothetical protein C8D86_1437 [Aquicella lusitana]VVC72555.1 hypothetical protein AQULUS_02670 [Aquicella lusitana]